MRAARTAEATKAEVREAAKAHAKAMEDAADAKALLDAAVGVRLGVIPLPAGPERAISAGQQRQRASTRSPNCRPRSCHTCFPEVFLRDNPGFDVLIGNPPWEKVKVEEHPLVGAPVPGPAQPPAGVPRTSSSTNTATPDPILQQNSTRRCGLPKTCKQRLGAGAFPRAGKRGHRSLQGVRLATLWQLVRTPRAGRLRVPAQPAGESGTAAWRERVFDYRRRSSTSPR